MRKLVGWTASLIALAVVFLIYEQLAVQVSSPSGPIVQSMMQDGADQVATDAVAQYRITQRHGTSTDRCAQAMSVTAAYLQAKNESQYGAWKLTEKKDCKAAGLPEMP